MHAKTETNAKILSLLYPATPSGGVFKILKKKILKYLATPSGGAFKIFLKKWKSTPQVQVAGYNEDKFLPLFRVRRNSKWRGTRK